MAERSTAYLARLLLATALLLPLWAQAQSEPLYQVELLVFSQPAGASAEHWDGIPELAYPSHSRFLIYPGEQPTAPAAAPASASLPTTAAPPMVQPGAAQPVPYATLPSGQRQFAGSAAAMQRGGRYHILFHEAWIQPMDSQAQALPIVLDRSGDGGRWPELQGTIKLYLSRYFYLETNLWLNTQGEYLPGAWRMPAPPLAPMSDAQESMVTGHSQSAAPGVGGAPSQPGLAGIQTTPMNTATRGPDYPFRHAVLLKQTRRMRSGEVAYVDHPLLGVLIRINPVTAPPAQSAPSAAPPTQAAPVQ